MRYIGWTVLLAAVSTSAAEGQSPNYYDDPVPEMSAPLRSPAPTPTPESPRKRFIVEGDDGDRPVSSPASAKQAAKPVTLGTPVSSSQVTLPSNMEQGVKDLDAAMESLGRYTGVVANHIQKNGIRGFLALPPEMKEQGTEVGRTIGSGISGIATDTARDMVVPGKK